MLLVSAIRRSLLPPGRRAGRARLRAAGVATALAAIAGLACLQAAWVQPARAQSAAAQPTAAPPGWGQPPWRQGAAATAASHEVGESTAYPSPLATIFPGDVIRDHMLGEREFSQLRPVRGGYVTSPESLVGKVARRTLMPGFPIPNSAVENAKLVQKGVPTQLVFAEGELIITTLVSPLQAGELNEAIRARNIDSGLIVYGVVQENGTLRAAGG